MVVKANTRWPGEEDVEGMRLKRITVNPGDFGEKYKTLDGHGDAHNRPPNEEWAKKLCKLGLAEVATIGVVMLLESEVDGQYYIIDGQHRIYAASELEARLFCFVAVIIERGYEPANIAKMVADLNAGRRTTPAERLSIFKEHSSWYDEFTKKRGIVLVNKDWPLFLRGIYAGTCALNKDQWNAKYLDIDPLVNFWKHTPPALIEESIKVYNWWTPAAKKLKKEQKNTSMLVSVSYAFAYILWKSYEKDFDAIKDAPTRLAKWPGAPSLVGSSKMVKSDMPFQSMLEGVNYHKQEVKRVHLCIKSLGF